MNQELNNYIKAELEKGTPKEEIKDLLITRGGWSEQEVEGVLGTQQSETSQEPSQSMGGHNETKSIFSSTTTSLVIAGLLVAAGLVMITAPGIFSPVAGLFKGGSEVAQESTEEKNILGDSDDSMEIENTSQAPANSFSEESEAHSGMDSEVDTGKDTQLVIEEEDKSESAESVVQATESQVEIRDGVMYVKGRTEVPNDFPAIVENSVVNLTYSWEEVFLINPDGSFEVAVDPNRMNTVSVSFVELEDFLFISIVGPTDFENDSEIVLDFQSTAEAVVFLSPYLVSPDPEYGEPIIQIIRNNKEVALLAGVLERKALNPDYLDDQEYTDALVAAIESVLEDLNE